MTKKNTKEKWLTFTHCKNPDANSAEVAWRSLLRPKMRGTEVRGSKKVVTLELRKIGGMVEAEASRAPGWATRAEGAEKEGEP